MHSYLLFSRSSGWPGCCKSEEAAAERNARLNLEREQERAAAIKRALEARMAGQVLSRFAPMLRLMEGLVAKDPFALVALVIRDPVEAGVQDLNELEASCQCVIANGGGKIPHDVKTIANLVYNMLHVGMSGARYDAQGHGPASALTVELLHSLLHIRSTASRSNVAIRPADVLRVSDDSSYPPGAVLDLYCLRSKRFEERRGCSDQIAVV